MKLVKSLLLGSAAGLMAVTGSMAADLPSRKAAPVDYVRVCSGGAGHTGFIVPGSDNCLQISGRVRADYLIGNRYSKADDSYGIRAGYRMNFDYRQQTAIGTVRAYVRLDATSSAGRSSFFYEGNGARNGSNGPSTANPALSQAYIQFGLGNGFVTAGRAPSFFDYYGNDFFWNFGAISGTQGDTANMLAYTANFGGGLTATVALEDRGVNGFTTNATTGAPTLALADPALAFDPLTNPFVIVPGAAAANTRLLYQGRSMPDLVANLRLVQGWGTAQLMGAIRQVAVSNYSIAAPVSGSKTGFALGAGVTINLPSIGAGSAFVVEGLYTRGALNYLGLSTGSPVRVGYAGVAISDYSTNAAGTTARLTEGFSAMAALRAQWTPVIRQHIFVGYTSVSYGANSAIAGALPSLTSIGAGRSFTKYEIGTNFQYTMAPGLNLGVEVVYQNLDPKGRFTYTNSKGVAGITTGSQSAVEGRFRIQRDF